MDTTNKFLIEIGCEDLPDWAGPYLEERWFPLIREALERERIFCGDLRFFFASRRVIVYGRDVAASQTDLEEEISGPPVAAAVDVEGKYTSAAIKFAGAHGCSVRDLVIGEKKGKRVIVLTKRQKGRSSPEIIGHIIPETLKRIQVPRAMRWSCHEDKFFRPIRRVVGLWNDRILPLMLGGMKSGRITSGHRVLFPGNVSVKDPDNYFDVLTKRAVLFDQTERRAFLTTMAAQALPADCSVSDEAIAFIARFVEYPFVAVGSIPEKFRELPPEVLTAVIKKLKCIPVVASGGAISPRFLIVTDGVQASPVTGNYEKVLGDKLEDAHFFMEQDMKRPLASYVEGAKRIVYHPRWGSVHDRIVRFRAIAGGLPLALDGGVRERLLQAIDLCKNDLATLMVAEFPDLQGVIGRIYAQKEGCDGTVAWAIEEHYLPKFPGDRVPRTIEAAVLSLLDRMETLCGFLLEGAVLSGSGDPFGLRRVTGGLIDIIWRKELSLPVSGLVLAALKAMDPAQEGRAEDIRRFIFQRAENLLAAEGISAGVRRAVLAVETEDLLVLRRKADALKMFLAEEGAADMLIPFTRVANILSQARDKKISSGSFSPDLLREPAERALHHFLLAHGVEQAAHADAARYAEFLAALRTWKDPVDAFFTDILVMVPDEALRNNRLALLAEVNAVFFRFADFSFLSGEVMKS